MEAQQRQLYKGPCWICWAEIAYHQVLPNTQRHLCPQLCERWFPNSKSIWYRRVLFSVRSYRQQARQERHHQSYVHRCKRVRSRWLRVTKSLKCSNPLRVHRIPRSYRRLQVSTCTCQSSQRHCAGLLEVDDRDYDSLPLDLVSRLATLQGKLSLWYSNWSLDAYQQKITGGNFHENLLSWEIEGIHWEQCFPNWEIT